MRSLLDVGMLIALLDAEHVHHDVATAWLAQHGRHGWATCPLTQNGCIRIISQPSYRHNAPARDIADMLVTATSRPQHEFWPDSISLLAPETLDWDNLLTGRHLTDVYLLALAVRNGGRLVTLDRSVPIRAVRGTQPAHLITLPVDNI